MSSEVRDKSGLEAKTPVTPSSHIKNIPFSLAHGSRIGLFGGSFNPPHDGHDHIARLALTKLDLQEVWWLVSPQNPLKDAEDSSQFESRLMQTIEVANHPRFRVSDLEKRLGTKYSIEIIRILINRFPNARFVWIVGADNFIQLPLWHAWEDIMQEIPVAVFARPEHHLRAGLCKAAERFKSFRIPEHRAGALCDYRPPAWSLVMSQLHPASSTAIRHERAADSTG